MMETVTATGAAIHGLFQNTHPLKAKWHRVAAPPIPRSSHSLSVINGRAYLFGGETSPGAPADNDMHIIILPNDYTSKRATPSQPGGATPPARSGHTASVIGERIFVFGGHSSAPASPLAENGRVWVYNTRTDRWTALDPEPGTPFPPARSLHASVGLEHPAPRRLVKLAVNPGTEEPKAGKTAAIATDEDAEGHGTLFVHAGCTAGGRLNDVWGFDVRSCTWREYPTAPGRARSGAALAVSKSRIYRFGGFNGEGEEGGQVDFLELGVDTFADFSDEGQGEVMLTSRRAWDSLVYESDANLAAQGLVGGNRAAPGNRSVAGLQCVTTGMGREYLVLLLGQREVGGAGEGQGRAGMFYGDVWAFQAPPKGMTGASWKDAFWGALKKETGEGLWSQVVVADAEGAEGEDVKSLTPGERGWFASAPLGDLDEMGILLWGGVNGKDERQADGWILTIE